LPQLLTSLTISLSCRACFIHTHWQSALLRYSCRLLLPLPSSSSLSSSFIVCSDLSALTRTNCFSPGAAHIHGAVSISGNKLLVFKTTFFLLATVGTIWIVAIGTLLYAMNALNMGSQETKTLANGSIYLAVLAFALVINVAIIAPALLMLQPLRLWHVVRSEKQAITPRQRFRGSYGRPHCKLCTHQYLSQQGTHDLTIPPMRLELAFWPSSLRRRLR
jgi:hypothetical protein